MIHLKNQLYFAGVLFVSQLIVGACQSSILKPHEENKLLYHHEYALIAHVSANIQVQVASGDTRVGIVIFITFQFTLLTFVQVRVLHNESKLISHQL